MIGKASRHDLPKQEHTLTQPRPPRFPMPFADAPSPLEFHCSITHLKGNCKAYRGPVHRRTCGNRRHRLHASLGNRTLGQWIGSLEATDTETIAHISQTSSSSSSWQRRAGRRACRYFRRTLEHPTWSSECCDAVAAPPVAVEFDETLGALKPERQSQ